MPTIRQRTRNGQSCTNKAELKEQEALEKTPQKHSGCDNLTPIVAINKCEFVRMSGTSKLLYLHFNALNIFSVCESLVKCMCQGGNCDLQFLQNIRECYCCCALEGYVEALTSDVWCFKTFQNTPNLHASLSIQALPCLPADMEPAIGITKQDQRKSEQLSCKLLSRCISVTAAFMDLLGPCLIIGFLRPVNSPISICCNMADQCRIYATKARLWGIQRGFLIKQSSHVILMFQSFIFVFCTFLLGIAMVKYCAAAVCRNGAHNRPDLAYFAFPEDNTRRRKWIVFCKRADKKFKSLVDPRICSLHF